MKKLKCLICSIIFALAITMVLPLANVKNVNATYSGNIVNNVIYVTFEDGDEEWLNEVPTNYSNNIKTIMENSYNNSTSSVNEYYKAMSFNTLNLTSNFYFSDENNTKAYKVPYTKNELLTYSPSNLDGYLKYEVCTYSSSTAPEWLTASYLTSTTHRFSCYDCGNSSYSGTHYNCDMDTSDGIACYCAAVDFASRNSKVVLYSHLEEYLREQIALKTVLSQINEFSGNIDSNNDGYIDAMTFIFPHADGVDWSDLLWAHQLSIINLSEYFPSYLLTPNNLLSLLKAHGVRNETADSVSIMAEEIKVSNKTCADYNLYLFSDLVYDYYSALKGADNKEIAKVFTLAHELGHVLGLPDYYTYIKENGEEDPVDVWDLMSYSYYSAPTYLTTYNREILGFTNSNNIQTLSKSGTYTLKPTCYDEIYNNNNNSNNVLAYVLEDPNYPNQKIYIEYRYKGGKFEPNYPSKQDGLIIYRVDNNVNPVDGYGSMLSSGNFGSYPFNMYVFRNNRTSVFNDTYNSYGNSNTNSTINAINFQLYDTSLTQDELTLSDITYINSGIVIENITINTQTNEISFDISGGYLKEPLVDLSSVTLNGGTSVNHLVNNTYIDAGINLGDFYANEFDIQILDEVNADLLGIYNYTYMLTHIQTGETKELIRIVKVLDTIKPTVSLIGDALIELTDINNYIELGVEYFDNYNSQAELQVNISSPIYNSQTGLYVVTYIVTDTSGNSTQVERQIKVNMLDFTSVKLIGSSEITHEVKTEYTDLGLDFGDFSESDFTITTQGFDNSMLGTYFYTYNLTHISSGYTFSVSRVVSLVDTTAPIITLVGGTILQVYQNDFDNFVDPGYDITDNYELKGSSTETQIVSSTEFKIIYYAIDTSNNETTVTRTVKLVKRPITVTGNQITFNINNNKTTEFFTNSVITLSVNYIVLTDNDPNVQVQFYVNNELIKPSTANQKSVTIKIKEAGIYNLKVVVGDAQITKQIIVNDVIGALAPNQMALISLLIVVAIIIVGLIAFAVIKSNANKINDNLDKY